MNNYNNSNSNKSTGDIGLAPLSPVADANFSTFSGGPEGKMNLENVEVQPVAQDHFSLWQAVSNQDWLVLLFSLCVVLAPAAAGDKYFLHPRERFFISTDATISYPGPNVDRFRMAGFIGTYIIAIFFFCICELWVNRRVLKNVNRAIYTIIYFSLDLGVSMCITTALTVYLKYYVGRYRPDFLARCHLKTTEAGLPEVYQGNSMAVCTNSDEREIQEGRVSYPSGHTSMAFCQGFYLLFYMLWVLYVREDGEKKRSLQKGRGFLTEQLVEIIRGLALFIGPAGALFVGASRIADYKHHAADVNAGAMVGIICSALVFIRGSFRYTRKSKEKYLR